MSKEYRSTGKSPYVHWISGAAVYAQHSESSLYELKKGLQRSILTMAKTCDRSLFVIDQLDHMREGIIDAILPF